MDDHNHGTHVSGTIGAVGDNGVGVVGVNWTTQHDGHQVPRRERQRHRWPTPSRRSSSPSRPKRVCRDRRRERARPVEQLGRRRLLAGDARRNQRRQRRTTCSSSRRPATTGSTTTCCRPTRPATRLAERDRRSRRPTTPTPAPTSRTTAPRRCTSARPASTFCRPPSATPTAPSAARRWRRRMCRAPPRSCCRIAPSRTDALKDALLSTVDPVPALASITITGGRLDVNGAIRSCDASLGAAGPDRLLPATTRVTLTWSGASGATEVQRQAQHDAPAGRTCRSPRTSSREPTSTRASPTERRTTTSSRRPMAQATSGDSNEAAATPKTPSDLVVASFSVPQKGGAGLPTDAVGGYQEPGAGGAAPTTTRFYVTTSGDAGTGRHRAGRRLQRPRACIGRDQHGTGDGRRSGERDAWLLLRVRQGGR